MLEPGPSAAPATPALHPPPTDPATRPAQDDRGPLARSRARVPTRADRERPDAWVLLAAWGPCGFSPVAPGTAGSLGALPLAWALSLLGWPAYVGATAVLLALGVVAAERAGRYWGVVDASPIVIDEVVGILITLAFVPFGWGTAIAGFVLFRVFDMWKPWPVSALDRWKRPLGVMLDDVGAAVLAWVGLQLLVRTTPWFG